MKKLFLYTLNAFILFFVSPTNSQDLIRAGLGFDFNKSPLLQSISFDFNRTTRNEENIDRTLYYNAAGFYIQPNVNANIGNGVSSSENNILVQIFSGKEFMDSPNRHKLSISLLNKKIEFNPSYNSDKSFNEQLTFGQFNFLLNYISYKSNGNPENPQIVNFLSVCPSIFFNLGYRFSKTFSENKLYSNSGLTLDFKMRIRSLYKNGYDDNWIIKLNSGFYYIISELETLTSYKYAGLLKFSIDKRIIENIYLGINYIYGNDNPEYNSIHTLDLSFKIKY